MLCSLFFITTALAATSTATTQEPAPVVDFEEYREEMEAVTITIVYSADGIPVVVVTEPFIKKGDPITAEDVKSFLE